MSRDKTSRRTFIRNGLAAGVAGTALTQMTAASHARVIGANDRINFGIIGCGARGRWLIKNSLEIDSKGAALVAACDVFKSRLEEYRNDREKALGTKPAGYGDYRQLLDKADIDAVVIATPDHQHCGMACDALAAGKHIYVEKPLPGLACDLPALNKLHDTVKMSKLAVQVGTQGASSIGAQAIKKVIQEGKLGKLFRVESTETHVKPYWINYTGPKTEEETDWKAWLYNRPARPFDAKMAAMWMGYSEITSGTIGGWMSHFVNLVHYVTDCGLPKSCVAWGGRYAPTNDPACTCFDQTDVILEYAEGFHTHFATHFGNSLNDESTVFMFEKGVIRCKFGHDPGIPVMSAEGVKKEFKEEPLLSETPPSPLGLHVKNWLDCIRNGRQPNANIDLGYKHGIAVVMGDVSWNIGRKVYFDEAKREVHPIPATADQRTVR